MSDTTNTTSLRERLLAEAKVWPRSDISGLLREAAAALTPPALDAPVVLGYIGASVAAHLREGGHAATTITGHKAMSDDVAIYASPVAAQAVTDGVSREDVNTVIQLGVCHEMNSLDELHRYVDARDRLLNALTHPNAAPCDAQGASNGR